MTRKDYVLIANVLSKHAADVSGSHMESVAVASTAKRMADALALDNPRFDRDKFLEACI